LLSITPDSEREFEVAPVEQALPQIGLLEQSDFHGKFVVEPLERGYGHTIGSALRRVLLSSIRGCAITAIKIDKVLHEFAAIPGVKEDTSELILNLKGVAVKIDYDARPGPNEDLILTLDVRGAGRVTAADIQCPSGVEITTPEVYIATISDKNASLRMEIFVGVGIGYGLPEKHERYKQMIGVIPMGSQFTPVRKVAYTIDPTRVGYKTDYERLMIDVETNGTVTPSEAVAEAGRTLDKFFRMFFDLYEAPGEPFEQMHDVLPPELRDVPEKRIEEMDFSQRTFNCLRRASLLTLRDMVQVEEGFLTGIRGFGKKSLSEVREKLAELGLELRPSKGGARPVFDDDDEDDF
jgi:DNA-directed RNA polymerase subunit alpha